MIIYVDIDETICVTPADRDYTQSTPIKKNIETHLGTSLEARIKTRLTTIINHAESGNTKQLWKEIRRIKNHKTHNR